MGHLDNQAASASNMNSLLWDPISEFGVPPLGNTSYQEGIQSTAWFMPFNIVPPEMSPDDAAMQYGHNLAEINDTSFGAGQQGNPG